MCVVCCVGVQCQIVGVGGVRSAQNIFRGACYKKVGTTGLDLEKHLKEKNGFWEINSNCDFKA